MTFVLAVTVTISPPIAGATDTVGAGSASGGWLARTPPFTVAAYTFRRESRTIALTS